VTFKTTKQKIEFSKPAPRLGISADRYNLSSSTRHIRKSWRSRRRDL